MTLDEYHQAGRLPGGLSVFSIDINGLKFVNDNMDRAAGDQIIRYAAECKRKTGLSLSSGYAIAEEHPDLSIEELINIADKMMYADKNAHYQNMGHESHRTT